MYLDRYSKIQVTGAGVEEIAERIALWMVPEASALRARRCAAGMPATWTASQLVADADLTGAAELRVQTRWTADRGGFASRLVHRDSADPTVYWHSVFRVTRGPDDRCTIECGVARSAPRGITLAPVAYPPRVFVDLLAETPPVSITERALTLPRLHASSARDARALVDDLLLREDRDVPVVVIASDVGPWAAQAHVAPDVVAKKLHGLAVIAMLEGTEATDAFRARLGERGYPADLACFNGGIHSYGPTADLVNDHQLWLGRNIAALPTEDRSARVGEALARRLALAHLPTGFFSIVEEMDRERRATVEAQAERRTADAAVAQDLLDDAGRRIAELERELKESRENGDRLERQVQRLEQDAVIAQQEQDGLYSRIDQLTSQRAHAGLSEEARCGMRKLLRCVTAGNADHEWPRPAEALAVVAELYPERIVVMEEARQSAHAVAAYRNRRDVVGLLSRLVDDYWTGMRDEPLRASAVFTKKELTLVGSETERKKRSCIEDRTRMFRGQELVMWKHLRAGGNGGTDRCLRIHFEWVAEEGKVVVGHCGAHLAA